MTSRSLPASAFVEASEDMGGGGETAILFPAPRPVSVRVVMQRKIAAVLVLALAAAIALASYADARQARRRDLQRQAVTELDTTGMSLEALRKLYVGTWDDQGGRFWFSIDRIAGAQVQSASFKMAHLKDGYIDGNQLTLNSMSCVPLIGCYSYAIKGKLLANSRMDMRATDETGDTVHFVLVRK